MLITLTINNTKVTVPQNTTILQTCNLLNITIPKFCYYENLQIAGNCRMCLVEVENSPKPVVSCSMPVMNNMRVFTNTPLVKKARETVLEFLLINHPLDCPICDQGGECDLQDQTLIYGSDRSRFFFTKRTVSDNNCSPFIKTIMTRCIHCTRCVRFAQEICNIDELGTVARGNHTKISFYLSKLFSSEYSANVIDLCPVGALTSKPYAFKTRPWELKEKVTYDLFSALGTSIVVQTVNNNIIRVLPRINNFLNIEWINNKTRFFFDSINYQRIKTPLLKKNGKFIEISWELAFKLLKIKIKSSDCSTQQALVGNFIGLEEMFKFKCFMSTLGIKQCSFESQKNNLMLNADVPNNFLYETFITKLLSSEICLLINYNPRIDCSLLNLKLKELVSKNNLQIFSIGPTLNLTYPIINLGLTLTEVLKIIEGKHFFCQKILKANVCTILTGSSNNSEHTNILLTYLQKNFVNKVNTISVELGLINYLEVIGTSQKLKKNLTSLLFLYNTDTVISKVINYDTKHKFMVYFGHHFNNNAQTSNLILPTLTFLEKKAKHLNLLGNILQTNKITLNQDNSKNDLILFSNILQYLKINKKIFNIKFHKLFIYLTKNLKKPKNISFDFNRFTATNSMIFRIKTDKFFPANVFEKNSKILTQSVIKLKKSSNFII